MGRYGVEDTAISNFIRMDWKRIISIVQKSQEKCIIIDPEHDEPVVIMPLSEYEAMHELYEDIEEMAYDWVDEDQIVPEGLPTELDIPSEWQPLDIPSIEHNTKSTELEFTPYDLENTDVEISDEEPWYIEPIQDPE